jgi:hypothetical protein
VADQGDAPQGAVTAAVQAVPVGPAGRRIRFGARGRLQLGSARPAEVTAYRPIPDRFQDCRDSLDARRIGSA